MDDKDNGINNNGFKLVMQYRYFIMGIAAIWIHVYHVWIPPFDEPTGKIMFFLQSTGEFIRSLGYCGVELFVLLSGMGLTYAIKKGSLLHFYSRRFTRVLPPYLIAAIVRGLVKHWSFPEFLENVTGFSFFTKNIHTFCWFVPAIVMFYLAFPLYYKFFCKAKSKLIFTALSITIWFFLSILLQDHMRFDLFEFTNRIPVFLIGIYFGDISQSKKAKGFTIKHYLSLIALLAAGLFLAYMYDSKDFELIIPNGKYALPNILLAISIALLTAKLLEIICRRTPRFGKLLNSVMNFWGKMSLEMYCVYVYYLVPGFMSSVIILHDLNLTRLPINLVIFAITTGLSWLTWLCYVFIRKIEDLPKKRKRVVNNNEQQGITE